MAYFGTLLLCRILPFPISLIPDFPLPGTIDDIREWGGATFQRKWQSNEALLKKCRAQGVGPTPDYGHTHIGTRRWGSGTYRLVHNRREAALQVRAQLHFIPEHLRGEGLLHQIPHVLRHNGRGTGQTSKTATTTTSTTTTTMTMATTTTTTTENDDDYDNDDDDNADNDDNHDNSIDDQDNNGNKKHQAHGGGSSGDDCDRVKLRLETSNDELFHKRVLGGGGGALVPEMHTAHGGAIDWQTCIRAKNHKNEGVMSTKVPGVPRGCAWAGTSGALPWH